MYQLLEGLLEVLLGNLHLVLLSGEENSLVLLVVVREDDIDAVVGLDLLDGLAVLADDELPELWCDLNLVELELFLSGAKERVKKGADRTNRDLERTHEFRQLGNHSLANGFNLLLGPLNVNSG